MAKTPPEQYFNVLVRRVGRAQLGDLIVQLSALNLTDFQPELVTEVKTFNRNTAVGGSNPEIGTAAFLDGWSKDHPTFKASDAVKALRADGRGGGSAAYPALNKLIGDGVLKKLGPGQYSRADVKHLAAPKKAKAKKPVTASKAKPRNAHHEVSNPDFLLRAMSRAHGKMSSAAIKRTFEKDGRASTGVGPTLHKLRQVGMIRQLGEGQYELTARAGKKPARKPNGNGAHVETPTAVEVTT